MWRAARVNSSRSDTGDTIQAEHVKPFADESKFWGSIWQSLGYPNEDDVFLRIGIVKDNINMQYAG